LEVLENNLKGCILIFIDIQPFLTLIMTEKLNDKLADKYINILIENCSETLLVKAKEYVRNGDRMHNFNKGAIKTGTIREKVLRNMRLKHDISVDDMLNDIENNNLPSKELVLEKFGDIINYNIIEAMSILHRIELKEKNG